MQFSQPLHGRPGVHALPKPSSCHKLIHIAAGVPICPSLITASPKARGIASTHAAVVATQSWPKHTPPWLSRTRMGKYPCKVCPPGRLVVATVMALENN